MPTPAKYFGFNAPFLGGAQNVMSRQVDDRIIKNDILQLVLTVPGERYGRPSYGTILRSTVFEQLDETTIEEVRQNLIDVITREETRVVVNDVVVTADADKQTMNVLINVSPNDQPLVNYVIEVQTTGAGTTAESAIKAIPSGV